MDHFENIEAEDFVEIEAEELELREDMLGLPLSWCCGPINGPGIDLIPRF